MTHEKPLYHYLALKANAMRNCGRMEAEADEREKAHEAKGNSDKAREARKQSEHYYQNYHGHLIAIEKACKNCLPSGSGFDKGTEFDFDNSNDNKLVFNTSFHHMNSNGLYCGWTDHTVTVTPCFGGINVKVSGKNYRNIKDYIAETLYDCLVAIVDAEGYKVL